MSSLERLPSDETDDGNVRLTAQEPDSSKTYSTGKNFVMSSIHYAISKTFNYN